MTTPGAPLSVLDFQRSYGTHWNSENIHTLSEWITIASYNIECLDLALKKHRGIIRHNTIAGLVISTLSGTLSVTQFGVTSALVSKIMNGAFTFFTFGMAMYTGYVKIYSIQERLEQYIKLKADWTAFSTPLASEFQLPIELRRDALYLITKNKAIYLDLLKTEVEISDDIRKEIREEFKKKSRVMQDLNLEVSTLPDIMIDICRKTIEGQNVPLLSDYSGKPEKKNSPQTFMLENGDTESVRRESA